MSLNHSPSIVTDGLVLCLDAANKRSYTGTGTTWSDLTSNNFDGTLVNGPTFVLDGYISYFQFDGTDDRADFSYLQPAYQTTTDFTWCLWYNPNTNNTDRIIIGNRHNSAGSDSPRVFNKLTSKQFEFYPTNVIVASLAGQWQQAILVKNQTNLYYYRNGELKGSATSSATSSQTHPFFIGGDSGISNEYANVKVSLLQIYDIAFNEDQVRQNYEATVGRYI